ncbi:hypothetical protein MSAN_00875300 [Mycena sanguinolenta]|uniref:Uncharacterized protein n=1 Tax=Mycena sanguinolenta TaxID=230812 RepID=A0A8H6Z1D6_9AGAR|nr:hypothetical protein MSAN_00875300 [Mycena sanguinolenta]
MAGNRKKSMAEELEELKAKYKAQEKELEAERRKNEKMLEKKKKSKKIPRPKGQAGRGKNGYNLQKEMQLQKDALRFHRLERIVRGYANSYLPTGKTITEQDPTKVAKLIELIQREVKYFQRFQGAWPIRAILKQYLRNAGDKLRRDLRLERAAEANDGDEFGPDDVSEGDVDEIEHEGGVNNNMGAADDADDEMRPISDNDDNLYQGGEEDEEDEQLGLSDDDSTPQLLAASWHDTIQTPKSRKIAEKENRAVVSPVPVDLDINFDDAFNVMRESSDFGDLYHPILAPSSSPQPLKNTFKTVVPGSNSPSSKSAGQSFLTKIKAVTAPSPEIIAPRKSNPVATNSLPVTPPSYTAKSSARIDGAKISSKKEPVPKPSNKTKPATKTTLSNFPPPDVTRKSSKAPKKAESKPPTEHNYATRSRH